MSWLAVWLKEPHPALSRRPAGSTRHRSSCFSKPRLMPRFRRLSAVLSTTLLFQWTMLGSGLLCEAHATTATAAPDGARGTASHAEHQRARGPMSHAAAPMPRHEQHPSVGAVANVVAAFLVNGCAGGSMLGCGATGAPSGNACGTAGSCTAASEVTATPLRGATEPARNQIAVQSTVAPPSWILGPDLPPPRV